MSIEKHIEDRKKIVGSNTMNKAIANYEKQRSESFVSVENKETGNIENVRSSIADRYCLKGTHKRPSKVFGFSHISDEAWARAFGGK